MCRPAPPPAPDPANTIAAQTAGNLATANQNAELNRVNQNTPYGSLTYAQNGYNLDGTANYTQNVSLSPQEQQIFNNQTQGQINLGNTALAMQGQVGNSYAQPIDTSSLPGFASSVNAAPLDYMNSSSLPTFSNSINNAGPGLSTVNSQNYGRQVKQAQNAAYYGQTQYLDPQFAQAHEALDNSLINQGITQGSQASNTAQQNLGLQQNQAYGNAANQAVSAGNAEQNTLFGQNLSAVNTNNAANQQGFSQGLAQTDLANTNAQQNFADYGTLTAANNATQAQQFGQGVTNANLQNQSQAAQLQQLFALRNQPLNEYNALMTGAQVNSPTFTGVPSANVAGTDVGGITNSSYQNQLAAYRASQQGMNNLFSLGGSLGAAAIMA
jgi:hypothetical protein